MSTIKSFLVPNLTIAPADATGCCVCLQLGSLEHQEGCS